MTSDPRRAAPLPLGPRVACRGVTLGYYGAAALAGMDGAFEPGSLTAIVGANGSGKSTLLKGIAGILRPLAGALTRTPADSGLAFLPQQSEIDRSFPARVADLAALGLWSRRGMLGRIKAADRQAIGRALDAVGLDGLARRGVDTLSGGQLQRALFARVIVQDARLILLDEPFSAIDTRSVADLLALIRRWHREGRTVVAVLHDLDLVREHFPRTLLLAGRPVAWGDTADILQPEHLGAARRLGETTESASWGSQSHPAERAAA